MSLTKRVPEIVGALLTVFLAAGCNTLDLGLNPNQPDKTRVLSDPASLPALAEGAMHSWYETTQGSFGEDQ